MESKFQLLPTSFIFLASFTRHEGETAGTDSATSNSPAVATLTTFPKRVESSYVASECYVQNLIGQFLTKSNDFTRDKRRNLVYSKRRDQYPPRAFVTCVSAREMCMHLINHGGKVRMKPIA